LSLDQLDEAKESFELLKSLGQGSIADDYLKKVEDAVIDNLSEADCIKYCMNRILAENERLFNENFQKTKHPPNSRTELRKSLPMFLVIAITTLIISIFLSWQFKN